MSFITSFWDRLTGRQGALPAPEEAVETDPLAALLRHINAERLEFGYQLLERDGELATAAREQAVYIAQQRHLTHYGPHGSLPWDRAWVAGYPEDRYIGECVAMTPIGKASVCFSVWDHSPPHHQIMMQPRHRFIGLALVRGDDMEFYWCAVFGS